MLTAVVVTVVVKVSGIDHSNSFGTHSECHSHGFQGIDANFLTF